MTSGPVLLLAFGTGVVAGFQSMTAPLSQHGQPIRVGLVFFGSHLAFMG
jgi:uncharacterized membrane protein